MTQNGRGATEWGKAKNGMEPSFINGVGLVDSLLFAFSLALLAHSACPLVPHREWALNPL